MSRTVVVPAAEACSVLDVLEADVHAVSAAVMASAAAAVSAAAARGGLLVPVRGSRCGIGAVLVVSGLIWRWPGGSRPGRRPARRPRGSRAAGCRTGPGR